MKGKERAKNYLVRLYRDQALRTFLFAALSFFITAFFTGYNIFLAIAYEAAWNWGIAVYYALVAGSKASVLLMERRLRLSDRTTEQSAAIRKRMYPVQGIFLLVIDLSLIAPIVLMIMQKRAAAYSMIPAISFAAYTTYKIVVSTRGFLKSRKQQNFSIQMLKTLNFTEMLATILSLQYIMVMTFSDGIEDSMKTLLIASSTVIWALMIFVSIFSMKEAVKIRFGEQNPKPKP